MQLLIPNKEKYKPEFIYNFVPKYIRSFNYHSKLLSLIDKEFDIDSYEIIKLALNNLVISVSNDSYIIRTNKNLKWKDKDIDSLLNLITYGNRSVKGYPIVYNIFEMVSKNLNTLYKDWLDRR